jgi:hypothetical protein
MIDNGPDVTTPGLCHVLFMIWKPYFRQFCAKRPERQEARMRDPTFGLALTASIMAAILAAPAAGIGAEETIDATGPGRILAVVQGYGEATLTTDNLGDPLIEGRIAEKDYRLFFYDCSEGRDCQTLTFVAGWEGEDITDEMMAAWNREKRFGKAFLDEDGLATVEMNVNLHGGVTHTNLDDTIGWWRLVLDEFADYFGF